MSNVRPSRATDWSALFEPFLERLAAEEALAHPCADDFEAEVRSLALLAINDIGVKSGQAYVHDNGFIKISLFDHASEPNLAVAEVRLHVWAEDLMQAVALPNVHNHSGDFVSFVVQGAMRQEVYEFADAADARGQQFREYAYGQRENDKYTMRPIGESALLMVRSEVVPAGHLYGLRRDKFHRTYPEGAETLTIFVRTSRNANSERSRVFANPSQPWPDIVDAPTMSESEIERILMRVRLVLERSDGR